MAFSKSRYFKVYFWREKLDETSRSHISYCGRSERAPFFTEERGNERVPEIRGPTNALQVCHHFIYVSLKLRTVRKETTKASSVF